MSINVYINKIIIFWERCDIDKTVFPNNNIVSAGFLLITVLVVHWLYYEEKIDSNCMEYMPRLNHW